MQIAGRDGAGGSGGITEGRGKGKSKLKVRGRKTFIV